MVRMAERARPVDAVLPCELLPDVRQKIVETAQAIEESAHELPGVHLSAQELSDSGILRGAIERLRGQQAASMVVKREFLRQVLDFMLEGQWIRAWEFSGSGERHDYELEADDGRCVVFEAKGCLDGNNTTIFTRPHNADEFYIWSLCQNAGADPRHNAWSGIHTRLSSEVIAAQTRVDGVIIWDMVCGTAGRLCPKTENAHERTTNIGSKQVPPPCLFLFPRSIPDARNNPAPPVWTLADLSFMSALARAFGCTSEDLTSISIEARMQDADVQRKTTLVRGGYAVASSRWTTLRRAR